MIHLPALISDLTLILGSAAITTLLFKKLKQPVVLGYIIAGLLVGPNFRLFPTIIEIDSIKTWADIGVIFLLFGLGLEFSFKKLLKVGSVALVAALAGVSLTMLLGFFVGRMLGWNTMDSLFLGGILAIASTTIIIRAFEELGVKTKKYTGIVMGVLVVEDLVAVVLMVVLSTVAVSRSFAGMEMLESVLKLIFFLILWFISGIFFLPTLLKRLHSLMSEETLLIVSLSLCFFMVYLATKAGFSPALGAFIMGSVLAETTKAEKIEHQVKSVKNLFGAIFFVSVGMLLDTDMLVQYALPILASTLVLLFGKPLFVSLGALATGQPLKIAIQSGMSLSQIGEFSFIIATLGVSLNVTSDFLYPVAVAVSVLTTFTTPFMIRYSDVTYRFVDKYLPEKWKTAITNYSIGANNIKDASDWKILLRFYFINIVIFSVIIITIIFFSTEYLPPLFSNFRWGKIIGAFVSLVLVSPFLWALAFRRTHNKAAYANVWSTPGLQKPLITLLLSRVVLAIFYIGFLFDRLFSPWVTALGVIVVCSLLIIFYKRIRSFYGRIEQRFLTNLNEREEQEAMMHALAPWDTHIATIELNPHSKYIGKTLQESKIREEFGINIAVIERGTVIINVPGRDERLYPNDVLSVIGSDEQLNAFKNYIESTSSDVHDTVSRQKVSLQHFTIGKQSTLLNKSIRNSGIREITKGLVVGIERKGKQILNPESDLVFELHDIIWIVGNEKRIQVLIKDAMTK